MSGRPLGKLLVANRGEIACRIFETCRRLGIGTVAVHSAADAGARHVRLADEAVPIGPAEAARSYLDVGAVVDAAVRAGADAVHPGYGFLAENAAFAKACADAGLTFVGPSPDAIELMGLKDRAKRAAALAGVPVVPGFDGEDQSDERLTREAAAVGLPLLVKPAAGGGGKGMRVVRDPGELAGALAASRREARAAFGDETLLLERLIEEARHVEVQVVGDGRGNAIHLYERDCSLQRRHQKIVEEARAPGLPAEVTAAMGEAAVKLAASLSYAGAGTVEFLVGPDHGFYFIEMNTRLQVEHPVTEMITGLDLVELQLRVAEGRGLPVAQGDVVARGHAIEARIYAEDPEAGFLPSTGAVRDLRWPAAGAGVRVDAGVEEGDAVSPFYDPMIAKLVVHGATRAAAIERFRAALRRTWIGGLKTNLSFLAAVAEHPDFASGAVTTGWLDARSGDLAGLVEGGGGRASLGEAAWARVGVDPAVLAAAWHDEAANAEARCATDPWRALRGFRLNAASRSSVRLGQSGQGGRGNKVHELWVTREDPYALEGANPGVAVAKAPAPGEMPSEQAVTLKLEAQGGPSWSAAAQGGERLRFEVFRDGERLRVACGPARAEFVVDPPVEREAAAAEAGRLEAPMPGRVLQVLATAGQVVEQGELLAVMEAMKMEHRITAPKAGTVRAVNVAQGQQVEEGAALFELDDEAEGGGNP